MQIVDTNNTSLNILNLGPKQKESLRLHIGLPANEQTSDYYFTLLFLENNQNTSNYNNEGQQSLSSLQGGIGLNVFFAIGDKETPQASISNFSTQPFYEEGPVKFNLTVNNAGDHFILPHGEILIKNLGQTVGKVIIPSSIILAGTSRNLFSNDIAGIASNNFISTQSVNSEKALYVVWPEKFLFGMYYAQLTLLTSDQGPIYTRTVEFFAFPVRFLLGLVIIVVIIYGIYLRVKKRL